MSSERIAHVRRPLPRPRGRQYYSAAHFARVGGTVVEPETFCGAPVTSYDLGPRDRTPAPGWTICGECRSRRARLKPRGRS